MTQVPLRSGIDLEWMDRSVRPQDDLYRFMNGRWLDEHSIPDDRASDGSFRILHDEAQEQVRRIIESASVDEDDPDRAKVAALYASFMDTERVEGLGTTPVQPLLDSIAACADKEQLATVLGRLQREGLVALIGSYIHADAKNSSRYTTYLTQSGLGLPDESYYREDEYAPLRASYQEHVARMFSLFGSNDGEGLAQTVVELETAIAAASWDRVKVRDADAAYNRMTAEELRSAAPQFSFDAWLNGLGAPTLALEEVVVRQPSFVSDVAQLWADRPLDQWKAWLIFHTASACASYLSEAVVEENFDFYGRTLSGTPQLRERWRRGVSVVERVLGDVVGKIYVDQHFSASSKEHAAVLVGNITEAYRRSITDLDWMSPATRERALEKLDAFVAKIGYPDEWKDYSTLEQRADDLLGNIRRAGAWRTDYQLAKLGRSVDRNEWLMNPQTVNAYYSPVMNEIVFPAAILQPPFFDAEADDAANYGGIGAVIGHEIGHGFDDQGARYDALGQLSDWWEETDRTEFKRRADALIEQFNALTPSTLPEHHVNGALTVGENIGDIGGLTIAIKAYEISLDGKEAPVIDGFSGLQRVLLAWAQIWRSKTRDEEAIRMLAVDPHSPSELRCNAIASNVDAFYEAFDVSNKDALFASPERRVRIW